MFIHYYIMEFPIQNQKEIHCDKSLTNCTQYFFNKLLSFLSQDKANTNMLLAVKKSSRNGISLSVSKWLKEEADHLFKGWKAWIKRKSGTCRPLPSNRDEVS